MAEATRYLKNLDNGGIFVETEILLKRPNMAACDKEGNLIDDAGYSSTEGPTADQRRRAALISALPQDVVAGLEENIAIELLVATAQQWANRGKGTKFLKSIENGRVHILTVPLASRGDMIPCLADGTPVDASLVGVDRSDMSVAERILAAKSRAVLAQIAMRFDAGLLPEDPDSETNLSDTAARLLDDLVLTGAIGPPEGYELPPGATVIEPEAPQGGDSLNAQVAAIRGKEEMLGFAEDNGFPLRGEAAQGKLSDMKVKFLKVVEVTDHVRGIESAQDMLDYAADHNLAFLGNERQFPIEKLKASFLARFRGEIDEEGDDLTEAKKLNAEVDAIRTKKDMLALAAANGLAFSSEEAQGKLSDMKTKFLKVVAEE